MSEEKKDKNEKFINILEGIETDLNRLEAISTKKIKELAGRINCELKMSIDLSADATSYRQILIDNRTSFWYKIYKDTPKLKQLKKQYFEHYSTKYPVKVNSTEKAKLIDADVAYHEAKFDYYQNHINFLTECIKTTDHVIYSVKNKIELYNATGLD